MRKRFGYTQYYRKSITSTYYRLLKNRVIGERGGCCEHCGRPGDEYPLQLHHKNYRYLGYEQPQDVELLCKDCHYLVHSSPQPVWRQSPADTRRKLPGQLGLFSNRKKVSSSG